MTDPAEIKQELAVQEQRGEARTIYDALALHRAQLERKVPTGILTYSYAEAALKTELRANDKLRECDPAKVLGAFAYGLQLGLVPGPLDLIHFVPFAGEVVFLVGYRGYVELAYRSGLVKDISASLVYEGDVFKVRGGTSPKIEHEIEPRGEREIVAAYAVSHLKTGGTVFRVIYEEDWARARKASQLGSKGKGPWADDFPAMVRKTAIRRLESLLPKSSASQVAAAWDETPAEPLEDGVAMLPEERGGRMIGSGQHIRIRMWNNSALVHDGVSPPGNDAYLRFSDGPQVVTHFAIERLTADDVAALGPPVSAAEAPEADADA